MLSTATLYHRAATTLIRSASKAQSFQNATTPTIQQAVRTFANDPTFGGSATPFYSPTLTHKRAGEAGRGGRSSEAGCKVAVFGGSGFLGGFVCAELGKLINRIPFRYIALSTAYSENLTMTFVFHSNLKKVLTVLWRTCPIAAMIWKCVIVKLVLI